MIDNLSAPVPDFCKIMGKLVKRGLGWCGVLSLLRDMQVQQARWREEREREREKAREGRERDREQSRARGKLADDF